MKIRELFSEQVDPAAEPGEYDQEGDMAKVALRTIIRSAQELHDRLGTDDNLPEWVQSKLTLAQDYLTTVNDYMQSRGAVEPTNERFDAPLEGWYIVKKDGESIYKGPFSSQDEAQKELMTGKAHFNHHLYKIKKYGDMMEDLDTRKLEAWKERVRKAYPEHAAKLKFKGYADGGKTTICAEVPGMDRCFGVFDMDTMSGKLLGEELTAELDEGQLDEVKIESISTLLFEREVDERELMDLLRSIHSTAEKWMSSENLRRLRDLYNEGSIIHSISADIGARNPHAWLDRQLMRMSERRGFDLFDWTERKGHIEAIFVRPRGMNEEVVTEKWDDSGASDAKGRWAKYRDGEIGVGAMATWLYNSRVHKKTKAEKLKSALGAIAQQQNTSKLISAAKADALRSALKRKYGSAE